VALRHGFNGPVAVSYMVAVVALTAPKALSDLPIGLGGG